MRVAILSMDMFGTGAVALVARTEAAALRDAGHEVVCLTGVVGELPGTSVVAVRRRGLPWAAARRIATEATYAFNAWRELRRLGNIDLVIAHGGGATLAAAPAGHRHRCPSVFVLHAMIWDRIAGGGHPYGRLELAFYRLADRFGLRRMSHTLAVSEHIRRVAVAHGAAPERALVRHNPADTEHFFPTGGKRPIDVLFVGRLSEEKGVDLLVDVVNARPHLVVRIVGDGRLREVLQSRAAAHVEFVGAVPRDRLPEHYRSAKICVVPSRSEPFPLVVLESLASGTPVLASRAGGIPEIVVDGVNGWLFPVDDGAALSTTLTRALEDDLASRSQNARRSAEAHSIARFNAEAPAQYEAIVADYARSATRPSTR